jgi:AcrR family transcriptional regulator
MTPVSAKIVRQDVARNRARLVQAAREVFAEQGLDATLDDVARHAGVGTGTAYRHFANKQELAAEVLQQSAVQIVADAEDALEVADPWLALAGFFETSSARQAVDRGLHQALIGRGSTSRSPLRDQLVVSVTELFARAKAAGVLRDGIEATDAAAIFAMLGPAFDISSAVQPDLWRRYLALLLDGIRASDRGPLPARALELARLDDAMAAGKRGERR